MHGSGTRRRVWAAVGVVGLILIAVILGGAQPAAAHPLGNFTTNRYARVEISAGVLRVYYVLDEAELRAFEARDALARDRPRFVTEQVAAIQNGLRLTIDGMPAGLTPAPARLDLLPGQGGLDTLRLAVVFSTPLSAGPHQATFADTNEPDRIGWREMVVVARGDARLTSSNASAKETSDELRGYPADLLRAPIDQRSATFSFDPGTRPADVLALTPPAKAASRAGGQLTRLVERQGLTPVVLAGMLGLAFLFGSVHAIGPGHGKTVMAAYLVGTSGRTVDAVLLGVIVSLMHTGSVMALGLVLFQLNRYGAIERIYPLLTVLSGLIVIAFGVQLLRRRLRTLRRTSPALRHAHLDHDHDHDHAVHEHTGDGLSDLEVHEHEHDEALVLVGSAPVGPSGSGDRPADPRPHDEHGHNHGPGGHTHDLPEGTKPLSRRGLVLLATSGGLLPSPSAVLVVVAAFATGRIVLGLSLVVAFSVGLAATLSAVGIALVFGRRVLERREHAGTIVRALPVIGALALLVVGLVLLTTGVTQL